MKVEQIYTDCLAQGSYYIESNGEAAVIDPLREIDNYINMAKQRDAKIKYIFEYLKNDIEQEYTKRHKIKNYYSESELWHILY